MNTVQALLLWPGLVVMDWIAHTFPLFVIRTGFGFWSESYLFWSAVIASVIWFLIVTGMLMLFRRWLRRGQRSERFG